MELRDVILPIEIVVCLLVTWPLVRQLAFEPFRYKLPCKAAQRIALLIGYFAFIAAVAVFAPVLLHFGAVLALGILLYERWRARPSYGRGSGLPPGSLGVVPRNHERDPYHFEKLIAKYGPIFKFNVEFHPYIYIASHKRALKFLRENDDVLIGAAQPISAGIPKGFVRYMPAQTHTKYRRILLSGISTDVIDDASPMILSAVRAKLLQICEEGCRPANGGVLIDDNLRELIFPIVLAVFFGVRPDTPQFDQIESFFADIDTRRETCGIEDRRIRAMNGMSDWIRARIDEFAKDPDAAPSCFLKSLADRQDAAALDATVRGNWVAMVEFATVDIIGLLQWLVKMLIDYPEWAERLRQEQGAHGDAPDWGEDSLAGRIVKETLRLERSEFLTRKSTKDVWFEGYRIPKDWSIRIGIRENNRDPETFDRPTEFDPDRFLGKEYSLEEYAPFGLFRHNCIGAAFASTVGRIFVTELGTGFDIQPNGEWTTQYVPPHWRPRAGFRLGLKARAA